MSFFTGDLFFWICALVLNVVLFFLIQKRIKKAQEKGEQQGYRKGYSRAKEGEKRRIESRIKFALRQFKIREKLLTIAEAAGLLDIKIKRLYHLRSDGKGPVTTMLGGKPFYRQVDVLRWRRAQGDADSPGSPDEAPPDCMNARGGAATR